MTEVKPQPAFARPYSFDADGVRKECTAQDGVSDWLYLVAHAPKTPLWDFMPHGLEESPLAGTKEFHDSLSEAEARERLVQHGSWKEKKKNLQFRQWPGVWADAMLAEQERRRAN